MARKATKPAKQKAPQKSNWGSLAIFLIVAGLLVVSFQTVVLLFFGMMPTLVARIIDRSYKHAATFCVGGMNFCGVFPYLLKLWKVNHTLAGAGDILTDVFALLAMYGSAAFGWMLFVLIPPGVVTFLNVMAQRRVAQLRTRQREIIEEWGEGIVAVATPKAPEPPVQQAPAAPQNGS